MKKYNNRQRFNSFLLGNYFAVLYMAFLIFFTGKADIQPQNFWAAMFFGCLFSAWILYDISQNVKQDYCEDIKND